MISRRAFLGYSAAAFGASALGSGVLDAPAGARALRTPDTFSLAFTDNSGAGSAFAYVNGIAPDGRLVLLKADGSPWYPASPPEEGTPLPEDCAIPLSSAGEIAVPKMAGARIYVVTDDKLDFFLNPGPALVHPSFLNSGDPNFQRDWVFAEFTFNDQQLYANISYVDFVATPLGMLLTTSGSGDQEVPGLPAKSLDPLAGALGGLGGGWPGLVQTGDGGRVLRALSPHHRADAFAGYLDGYIDEVWQKYTGTDLVVDSQRPDLGTFTGRVNGGNLVFDNGESFTKPVTADVFSCDSGPFALPGDASEARKSIVPRLAAALNRTTLLDNPNQPTDEDPATFYQHDPTNHYARLVHEALPDNRGYAFPYDDVSPGPDFSGAVHAGDPEKLTITVNALR